MKLRLKFNLNVFFDFKLNIQIEVSSSDGSHEHCDLKVSSWKFSRREVETGGSHEHYEYFRTYFSGGDRAAVEKRMALLDKLGSADSVESFVGDALKDAGDSGGVTRLTNFSRPRERSCIRMKMRFL